MPNRLVTVYGTLKNGYHNYNIHLSHLEPLFSGFIKANFQLYSNGRYPMAIKTREEHLIYVEVYDVSDTTFDALVQLETPFGYHYEKISISEINDDAEIFVYTSGVPPPEFTLVENGNWKPTVAW